MPKRPASAQCKVFPGDGGFRIVHNMSRVEAEFFVDRGVLDREYDRRSGRQLGYRIAGGARDKVDGELRSAELNGAIGPGQMESNAFAALRHPFSLRWLRKQAEESPENAETARLQAKIFVYKRVGPERGAILTAWPL